MNIDWNAKDYTKDFSFVHEYGEDVLHLLDKTEGLVIDLGCGNGALTKKISDMGYRVIGIDDSDEMLEEARKLHPDLTFIKGNALTFSLEEKADIIFSNAVFHWIDEELQETLIKNLYTNLKPNGQLICEFGGYQCAEKVHSALEKAFWDRSIYYPRTFYFPTIGQYTHLLEKHQFLVTYATLFDRPTKVTSIKDWITMFVQKPFETMNETLKEEIIHQALSTIEDQQTVDYVRIRIRALRQ